MQEFTKRILVLAESRNGRIQESDDSANCRPWLFIQSNELNMVERKEKTHFFSQLFFSFLSFLLPPLTKRGLWCVASLWRRNSISRGWTLSKSGRPMAWWSWTNLQNIFCYVVRSVPQPNFPIPPPNYLIQSNSSWTPILNFSTTFL